MAKTSRQRSAWGSVRKLPSGRYQARYQVRYQWFSAPTTFRTKRDADTYLASVRTDIERGAWLNPEAAKISFDEYATAWLKQRHDLRPRTRELYEGLLRHHLLPVLGEVTLKDLSPSRVRSWHAGLVMAGKPGPSTIAKCYRLLHVILATAVADEVIVKNPCVLRGASVERPVERPVATIEQVYELADAIEPSFSAMVLLATFTGLRLGELRALTRKRLDLLHKTVQVVEQYQELSDGTLVLGPPKTDAGRRTVAVPDAIVPALEAHLAEFAVAGPEGLLFPGTMRQPMRRATFYKAWLRATKAVGIDGFRFHDLRHTGNTLAAATGASTKELMSRMGHASPRAALIYQHATQDRDAEIATALSNLIEQARSTAAARTSPQPMATLRSKGSGQ